MTEAHANALQTIIGEFKNISPEITNAFIFKANGEIVASDEETVDEQSKNLVTAFNGIFSKAEIIGGIKTVTMQGSDRQLNITCMNNRYLATVFSREADEKIIKSLTCVIVPAVIGLGRRTFRDASCRKPLNLKINRLKKQHFANSRDAT